MHVPPLNRVALVAGAALLLSTLAGCAWMPFQKKAEAAPAPLATTHADHSHSAGKKAAATAAPTLTPADLQGQWECQFQAMIGEDRASFTYTDQFNADGTLKAQAYLVYELANTPQPYRFATQGSGHWRLEGNTITLIVPQVIKQDRSDTKHPELLNDKDLVPEDLSDTWTVLARQGKSMRVAVGSLADEMLCSQE